MAASVDLTPSIQETCNKELQSLQKLSPKSKPLAVENLATVGTDALPVTCDVTEVLRGERDQDILTRRPALDVSLTDMLSKTLPLQRLMFASAKEPNITTNDLVTQAVDQQINLLQQEILNLKTELEFRRELANNSPIRIIECGQQHAPGSNGVSESASDTDRLDRLQVLFVADGKSGGEP